MPEMNMKRVNATVDIYISLEQRAERWRKAHPQGNQRDWAEWQKKGRYAELEADLLRLEADMTADERLEYRRRIA